MTKHFIIPMPLLFVCTLLLVLFVVNTDLVISGASYGLMLWYKNVLPMLLPFMLISGIMVRQISYISRKKASSKVKYGVFTTLFLGMLCGYPIGAKTCGDFIKNHTYNSKIGNIILPLCNNSSPMFISGYIVYRILNKSVSFFQVILCIYIPYILVTLFTALIYMIFCKKNGNFTIKESIPITPTEKVDINQYLLNTINQITLVGIYIMICSIAIEFIMYIPNIHSPYNTIMSGILEITRGTLDITSLSTLSDKIKTALIIAITSFGGISSILQTQMVIQKSGLSIIYYTMIKALCASLTYILCILFI